MSFNPTSFANLSAFSSGTNFDHPTFGGDERWSAATHECATWTDPGHILGSTTCPGWDRPPDPDALTFDWSASGADFITIRIVSGDADATFDVGSGGGEFPACKLEADGGGCNFRDPLTGLMEWRDQRGEVVLGVEDDGTANGAGPWQVSPATGLTGPNRLVNPHRLTYFGMDPTNDANEILWRPDDLTTLEWRWAGAGFTANMAGSVHGLDATFGFTLWKYIEPPTPDAGLICWL